MIECNPPVRRIGFAIAAAVMSAITFSLMVVLPSALEQDGPTLALRAEPHRAAAKPAASDAPGLPCTVATAVNAPLSSGAPSTAADSQCRQPS